MHIRIKLTFWIYRQSWLIFLIGAAIGFGFLFDRNASFEQFAAFGGGLVSLFYFLQKQKLDELKLFKELFKEFNERYDRLNETLDQIKRSAPAALSDKDRESLIDYFNLCSEEYFYFTRGYIDPIVWDAWANGMREVMSDPLARILWSTEKLTDSYYDLDLEFKSRE